MDQELRRRHPDEKGDPDSEAADSDVVAEGADSEPEDLAKSVGRGTEATPEVLDGALASLPPRWRNWVIRGIFTWVMIIGFGWIVYIGPLALMAVVLIVQVKCFSEIINIGYAVYRIHGLPWFRSLSWWFLLCSNYFLYGESLVDYFIVIVNRLEFLRVLVTCHRMISFGLYIVGFVWFVLSLVKKYYMKQFSLFAWTHVALLIVVTQSYLIIQNIFEGMIWLIVPVSMIIINDVMAYIFGFFFGRTPLIQLSPKKTWEGFIGGGVATVFIGLLMSQQLAQYAYFTCPLEYSESLDGFSFACQRPPQFVPQQFALPAWVATVCRLFGMAPTLEFSPFLLHALVMGLFSSIIGPFGGFFASGFKRAFKIKDFGDLIPGHGGIMDRFDCQFLMATFVNVYIFTFVKSPSTHKILQQVYTLKPDQQVQLYSMLRDGLAARGLLG